MDKPTSTLESLLAWRCGYATGLRVAVRMYKECHDPESRIAREIDAAIAEARTAYHSLPEQKLN